MNSLINKSYDNSKKDEIQLFLERIQDIARSNPRLVINSNLVYSELERYGLSNFEFETNGKKKSVENFFPRWADNFKDNGNIDAYNSPSWPYWFQFVSKNDLRNDITKHEYIKLYIPLNLPHLYEGVNKLFGFISNENIEHVSKVAKEIRSDNIIVRVKKDDYESVNKILDFIANDRYLSTGLNKVNPFIPTINGVGIMEETGNSYNNDMSKVIAAYINYCLKNNKKVSAEEFKNGVLTGVKDDYLKETFEAAYTGRRKELDPSNKKKISDSLVDAFVETYQKYGLAHIKETLRNIIENNNYSYITNGTTNLRRRLKETFSKEEIEKVIKSFAGDILGKKEMSIREAVDVFSINFFENDLIRKLDDSCELTVDKYGKNHLVTAIVRYISSGDPRGFTRYKDDDTNVNYRDVITDIGRIHLMEMMHKSLRRKGIMVPDDSKSIVTNYVDYMEKQVSKKNESIGYK